MSVSTWPAQFFNQRYLDMFMLRSPQHLELETKAIAYHGRLSGGQRIGDFCCGVGDLLGELHSRYGIQGEGVELVESYVKRAATVPGAVKVHHGDALTHAFAEPFDVVLNWFSSFGYFDTDSNCKLLANMYQHTKPGGQLLLETYNSDYIRQRFVPKFHYDRVWEGRPYSVTRESVLACNDTQMHQTWRFQGADASEEFHTAIQLYRPTELVQLVHDTGFTDIQLWATPTLERPRMTQVLSEASPRLLLVARR